MLSNLLSALVKPLFKPLNKVTGTSMSVHNGFKLWTLIFYSISSGLYEVSRFLCLLTFSLMRILLWGYTQHRIKIRLAVSLSDAL